ncbi:MAG: trimethylamine methyltransferase family protein [Desulfarculaceae bacterium]|nr:trimethylamine methyltransferase family protein [Desulfarculaceae bacterium]
MELKNEQVLLDAILDYMATTGVEIDDHKFAVETFRANGCTVTDNFFVKIPADVALAALSKVPRSFKWWDRAGETYLEYGGGKKYVIGDMRAPAFYNPHTKKVEPANSEALLETVKMMNYLPHVHINGNVIATDNYNYDNANVICNSNMPMMLGAGNYPVELENLIRMAIVVRGSREALKAKPFIVPIVSGLMLKWPSFLLEQIRLCAEYDLPVFVSTMPVGGVSGPVTIPGNILLGVATTLFGIILAQLAKPGLPSVDMYHSTYMDQANGKVGGMPENYLGEELRISMLRNLLGIPTCDGTTICSNAYEFKQDAVFEMTYNFRDSYMGITDGYWGIGALETGLIYSPHGLIFTNELIDMAERELVPLEINSETLPLDLIREIRNGVYIAEDHTVENMNKYLWRGKYYHFNKVDHSLDIFDRLDKAYFKIMEEAEFDKIEPDKEKEIMEIAARAIQA